VKVLFCSYGEFNRSRPVGPAEWPHFDLLFIHEGEVELKIGNQAPLRLATGQAILFFPHTPFSGTTVSEKVLASVHHFTPDGETADANAWPLGKLHGRREGFLLLDAIRCPDVQADLDRSLRLADTDDVYVEAMRASLLRLILVQLIGVPRTTAAPPTPRRDLRPVLEWLRQNTHRPIVAAEMASRARLSESQFRRLFRDQFGTSPVRYHQELRILEACRRLRQSMAPVKSISQSVGFDDVPQFYRCFRKNMKMTPVEYRRRSSPRG